MSLLRGFFQVGGKSKFSAGGSGLPSFFPEEKPIYIYNLVLACVLIPLVNHNPSISLSPEALKNVISRPRHAKSPDNSNCSSCLAITLIFQNSLQTRLNSQLLYSSDLTEPKMSQNQALTDCLAKTGRDQHLNSKPYFIFESIYFFDKKHSKLPRQIFNMVETL